MNKHILLLLLCCCVLGGYSQSLEVYDGVTFLKNDIQQEPEVPEGFQPDMENPMNTKIPLKRDKVLMVLFKVDHPHQVKKISVQIGHLQGSGSVRTETYTSTENNGIVYLEKGNSKNKVWSNSYRLDYKITADEVPNAKWCTLIVESVNGSVTTQTLKIQ